MREILRVVRPGGRLVVCEFSHPTWAPFRTVYTEYLMKALPTVARRTSSNPEAYVYLAESIRAWPDQEALAADIRGLRLGAGAVAESDGRDRHAAPARRKPERGVIALSSDHYAFVGRELIHKCANREEQRA